MTSTQNRIGAASLAALTSLMLAACGTPASTARTAPAPASPPTSAPTSADRLPARTQPYTEADARFMSMMIAHHAQAIVMSRWAATHGASESVQTLAQRIINAQRDEIRTMQQWLRDRKLPVPVPDTLAHDEMTHGASHDMSHDMPGMSMPSMQGNAHDALMPGMLTPAQMHELDMAKGRDFDRLFLTFMIQHHSGAISMVKDLFDSYGAAQDDLVFKLASDINVDQTTEVARMQRMLLALMFDSPGQ